MGDSFVPVASTEALVATVDPDRVDIGKEEGGKSPDLAGVLFRHCERLRHTEFRVHLHLDDLPRRRPDGYLNGCRNEPKVDPRLRVITPRHSRNLAHI